MESEYKLAVKNVKHHKALGKVKIYLNRDGEFPWEYVTHVEDGCSYRLDIAIGCRFTAEHPCGLQFNWGVDLEPVNANGSGMFHFDTAIIGDVMSRLPAAAKKQFAALLGARAKKVREMADKWMQSANSQYGQAACLEQMATR
jgi:hypothetical protein